MTENPQLARSALFASSLQGADEESQTTPDPQSPHPDDPTEPVGDTHGTPDVDSDNALAGLASSLHVPTADHGQLIEPLHGDFGHPAHQTPGVTIIPPRSSAPDWGATSLGMSANAAAGVSYLGWWLTGLLIYFNERQNWYVRFHAFQSVLYTGALTILSVLGFVVSSLLMDLYLATRQLAYQTISRWLVVVVVLAVVAAWLTPVIAAWCGYRLRIPFVAPYAERYAAPFVAQTRPQPDTSHEDEIVSGHTVE